MINIALDVMGGDNAPLSNLHGALDYLLNNNNNVKLFLIGDKSQINNHINEFSNINTKKYEIINCSQYLGSSDKPSKVHKEKPNSSMVIGLNMLKEKKIDAFISAGNTGHLLASSFFVLGTVENIIRPALFAFIPSNNGHFLICDVGANTSAKPQHLLQFGQMSSIYIKHQLGIIKPRISLLNIGSEENKGNELTKSAYHLLKENLSGFNGNIESRYIFNGKADILLTDGFTGNMVLKLIEGMTEYNFKLISKELNLGDNSKIEKIKKLYDYEEYGATPILGVNGLVLKSHGSSSRISIKNALINAVKLHKLDLIKEFKNIVL